MSDIKQNLIVPIKVFKQGANYMFSCIELEVIEESPNFYFGLEETKKTLIQRVVQKTLAKEKLPRFNIDKAVKQGAVLIELPGACIDNSLERVTLTIPKNIIIAIDAETNNNNRSKFVTQVLQQYLEQKN